MHGPGVGVIVVPTPVVHFPYECLQANRINDVLAVLGNLTSDIIIVRDKVVGHQIAVADAFPNVVARLHKVSTNLVEVVNSHPFKVFFTVISYHADADHVDAGINNTLHEFALQIETVAEHQAGETAFLDGLNIVSEILYERGFSAAFKVDGWGTVFRDDLVENLLKDINRHFLDETSIPARIDLWAHFALIVATAENLHHDTLEFEVFMYHIQMKLLLVTNRSR